MLALANCSRTAQIQAILLPGLGQSCSQRCPRPAEYRNEARLESCTRDTLSFFATHGEDCYLPQYINEQRTDVKEYPMTEPNTQPQGLDEAIRTRVIERARAINTKLLAHLATVADDLDAGGYRAAIGGLDGLERQIETMRSLLLLLS